MAQSSDPTSPIPRYVYKILSSAPPTPLPEDLPLSPLDAQDGFIHLSAAWRVPLTASQYFADAPTLWLLRLDVAAARAEDARLAWADPGCVHMFAAVAAATGTWARVGRGIAVDERAFVRGEGESWKDVLGREVKDDGWLHD